MTVALGTNIANPISTALSQWLGFDTMGKLANYGKLGAAADPDAVIEALFANNEQGLWYDFSDLTTMFQDRAGTTPVTADGQTVGKILDKSGRGNHATAPSDAARPLYKTSGGLHWLQFDGVDDSLSTAAINFTSTNKMGVFAGAELVAAASSTFLVELSANALGNAGAFYLKTVDQGANYLQVATNTTDYLYGNSAVISRPVKKVIAQLMDLSISPTQPSDQLKLRLNASPETLSTVGYMITGSFGTYPLYVASRANGDYYFGGKLYSMIVRCALSDTQEITDTETWVNGKTGAY